MTDQEILDEVGGLIGNTKIESRVATWVNSFLDEHSLKYTFPHLRRFGSLNTIVGTQEYVLANDMQFLRNIWCAERKIDPLDETTLTNTDPKWNINTGSIVGYVLYYRNILLYKIPSSIQTVYYSYQGEPTLVVAGKLTTYTGFPRAWHQVVVQGGLMKGYENEGNTTQQTTALGVLKGMVRELMPTVYRRPDVQHALRSEDRRRRLPVAQLPPDHFPTQ